MSNIGQGHPRGVAGQQGGYNEMDLSFETSFYSTIGGYSIYSFWLFPSLTLHQSLLLLPLSHYLCMYCYSAIDDGVDVDTSMEVGEEGDEESKHG